MRRQRDAQKRNYLPRWRVVKWWDARAEREANAGSDLAG